MLFVVSAIRSLALHKKKKEAELAISEIAHEYMKIYKSGVDIVLVYDHTSLNFTKEVQHGDSSFKLTVLSSGKYGNSDDALVDWAE